MYETTLTAGVAHEEWMRLRKTSIEGSEQVQSAG